MRQVPLEQKHALLPIFIVTFLITVCFTVGFPTLTFLCFDQHSPLFLATTSYKTRSVWYGLCSSLPHWIAILSMPILSIFSDYYGRKKLLLLVTFGSVAASICAVLSIYLASLGLFLVGLLIIGAGTRIDPIAIASVGDLSLKNNLLKNMGILQCSIALGALIGPLCGGILAQLAISIFKFSLPYYLGITLSFAAILIVLKQQQQKQISRKPKINFVFSDFYLPLKQKKIRSLSLLLILSQIAWRTYYQFMPPLLKIQLHYKPAIIGYFLALLALWLGIATTGVMRALTNILNEKQLLRYCFFSVFIGSLLAIVGSFANNKLMAAALLWSSSLPIAMGDVIAFCIITTLYINAVSEEHKGKIMGLCFFIVSLVWAITGVIGGILAGINLHLPLCFAILGITICLMLSKNKFSHLS